jgi:hypothetical protein
MTRGRYVKEPGAKTGRYLPCPKCLKVRCECLELRFLAIVEADGLPKPGEREYRFTEHRAWRADFAYPNRMILVEIEGGGGIGRHTSVAGFREDMVKYNAATALGWRVYRFDARMMDRGIAAKTMRAALGVGPPYVPAPSETKPKRPKIPENARKSQKSTEKPEKLRKSPNTKGVSIDRPSTNNANAIDPVQAAIEAAKNTPVYREEGIRRLPTKGRNR